MPSKKGFWTLTRTVRVTYTQRDDYNSDNTDDAITLKTAKADADRALEDANSDVDMEGIVIETIPGENWKEDDFEEDEE